MKLFSLWLKEVFSHSSFILSNLILLLAISLFTFAFTFFNSITVGTDALIRGTLSGDYLISVPSENSNEAESDLKNAHINYDKMALSFALFKTKNASYPIQVRKVNKSFFTPERMKMLGIKTPIQNGLYLSKGIEESEGAILYNGEKRARIVKRVGTFHTGLKMLDENIAFLVVDEDRGTNDNEREGSGKTTSLMISGNAHLPKNSVYFTVSRISKNYRGDFITAERIAETFYSSLSGSKSSFYFISMLFVLLASFYAVFVSLFFKSDNRVLLREFELWGTPYSRILWYSVSSVVITVVIFIITGFILGTLEVVLFPSFASFVSRAFSLDTSYYFLNFPLSLPLGSLLRVYVFEILLSFVISLLTFLITKRQNRELWH